MGFVIEDDTFKKIRTEVSKIVADELYSDKFRPHKLISGLCNALEPVGGSLILSEIEKLWQKKNDDIENQIYREFGGKISSEEVKQLRSAREKNIKSEYKISKSFQVSNVTPDMVKNWLPEDKILYNRDIFYTALKDIDFSTLPPVAEKRIIDTLEKESIGLSKQEAMLYYNLIKINKLAVSVEEEHSRKKREEKRLYRDYARLLINQIFPKHVKRSDLNKLNDGKTIPEHSVEDSVYDKIMKGKFNPRPYIILFGYGKNKNFVKHFKEIFSAAKNWDDNPERVFHLSVAYILFSNIDEDISKHLNLCNNLERFVKDLQHKENPNTYILIHYVITFFYALITQCLDITAKYQSSTEDSKKKLFKLYSSEERINMLINNAFNFATKRITGLKGGTIKITEFQTKFIEKYLNKNKGFLTKDDIFETIITID